MNITEEELLSKLNLKSWEKHKEDVSRNLEEMKETGEITEEDYKLFKQERRRIGKTTKIAIKALLLSSQGTDVAVRVFSLNQKKHLKDMISNFVKLVPELNDKNILVVVARKNLEDLKGLEYEYSIEDDSELYKDKSIFKKLLNWRK